MVVWSMLKCCFYNVNVYEFYDECKIEKIIYMYVFYSLGNFHEYPLNLKG